MIITCERSVLSEGIGIASRAVATRSSLPVLEGLLIKTMKECIKITGYDLENGIECIIPATVEDAGDFVVNASTFGDIVRKLPNGEVVIKKQDNKINIKAGQTEFDINCFSSEDYPDVVIEKGEFSFSLPQNQLKSIISQTVYAVSTNESKPVHTGCLFNVKKDTIEVVGVDGFRLAKRNEKLAADAKERTFIVPGKTLSEISRIIGESEELVHFYIGRKTVLFETENVVFISRLIEGEFMDYMRVIPTEYSFKATVTTKELIDSLERVSLLVNEKQHSPVKLKFNNDKLEINCSTPMGRLTDKIEIQSNGGDIEIGFNNKLLLDALKNTNESEVFIELSGSLAPLVIKPLEGDKQLCLVLPVRLKNG